MYNGKYGVETDDNGLYYMRARYYNPDIKRFINQDVVQGSLENAISLNRFAYANGNPISYIDPFGLSEEEIPYEAKVALRAEGYDPEIYAQAQRKLAATPTIKMSDYMAHKWEANETKFDDRMINLNSEEHKNKIYTTVIGDGLLFWGYCLDYLASQFGVNMEANTYKRMNAQGITIFTADELRMGEMANVAGTMSFGAIYAEAMIGSAIKAKLPRVVSKGTYSSRWELNLQFFANEEKGNTKELYRVMSEGEYQSLINNKGKFTEYDLAMEDKWFATSITDADKWGKIFYPDGNYRMINFTVNSNSLEKMYFVSKLDNIGPAYCAEIESINAAIQAMKVVR